MKIEDGKICTDLYVKPTDKQLYLNSKSCHPPSTKKGLAFGLGLRLKRICEKPQDYEYQRRILIKKLRQRGYSGKTINSQMAKVDKLDRGELLKKRKRRKESDRVLMTVTYSNLLPDLNHIIRKHTKVLYKSERMTKVFQEPPMVAYRRDRNLGDSLVRGKTNKQVKKTSKPCKLDCDKCARISDSDKIISTTGEGFKIPNYNNCRQHSVVYSISCKKYETVVYVGETERQLNERMTEHLRDIKLQRDKPINGHFSKKDPSEEDAVFFYITTSKIRLQDREIDVRINLDTEITDSPAGGV